MGVCARHLLALVLQAVCRIHKQRQGGHTYILMVAIETVMAFFKFWPYKHTCGGQSAATIPPPTEGAAPSWTKGPAAQGAALTHVQGLFPHPVLQRPVVNELVLQVCLDDLLRGGKGWEQRPRAWA